MAVLAVTTVGITAGVMFCYQFSIMPGLRKLPDDRYIEAFQDIDEETVNPLFVGVMFLGGAALLVASTVMHLDERGTARFALLGAATATYLVGVVAVTLAGHVPKNEALARLTVDTMSPGEISEARLAFEGPWLALHRVRALAAVASFVLAVCALGSATTA